MGMRKNTIIFDLDGTLADINERKQKAQWESNDKAMDWDVFFDPKNIMLDKPKYEVIKCLQMFRDQGYKIVIFSGRNDRSFHTTKEWLADHNIFYDLLVLRPDKFKDESWPVADGNPATFNMRFMPDEILKKEMLDTFVDIDDVFIVFEDRKKVVNMWRELGLTCFEVEEAIF
tara:strand:+ start:83 stop:601 length:519 start_codon:yes stop_codon:yes gene_type:complete